MSGRVRRVSSHLRAALDKGWELREGGADAAWRPVGAPGTVASALLRQSLWSLDDPPKDFDASEWWFRTQFDAPASGAERLVLGLDGLATLAEVTLNDVPLLSSQNMFVSHELEVASLLQRRGNRLTLRFPSLNEELARRRPRPRWRVPMLQQQQLRWQRTTLLGRTPGWSPPAAAVGPWRGVWLESRSGVEVDQLRVQARVEGDAGRLDIACRIAALGRASVVKVEASLSRAGRTMAAALEWHGQYCSGSVSVPGVALWWPHTHGEPCQYALVLRVSLEGAVEPVEVEAGEVGFRTLRWDTDGDDFALLVNGVSVFCRGACWTPLDALSLHAPPTAYAPAIAQVRSAGMNMLRVNGTMVYESDAFYDACDAQGVLVWQDLMFANMDYPAEEAFVASVRQEVSQQIERWQGRAAIALLCGNSEGEQQAAMWGAPRSQWAQALFDVDIRAWVAELAPDLAYWPSSAHGGAFPFQADAGSASYYGVGAYLRPLDDATRCGLRFASECLAFANIPESPTLAHLPGGATKVHQAGWKARSPRDLGAGWDFDDVRDHYLHTLYGIDVTALRSCDHERYLMLGRAVTGEVMSDAFVQWRSANSGCRGALVWFWRDLWAGAGWGLLDDTGQPKACWWMLKRVLQPLLLAVTDEGVNGLCLQLANDDAEPIDVLLRVTVYRDGHVALMRAESSLTLAGRERRRLPVVALLDEFVDLSHSYRFGPRGHDVVAAQLLDAGGEPLAQAVRWFDNCALVVGTELGLRAGARELGNGLAEIFIATDRAARGVHLDIPGWIGDDNHFDLLPGGQRTVQLRTVPEAPRRPLVGRVMALNARSGALIKVNS
jgi:beta-mannosidase